MPARTDFPTFADLADEENADLVIVGAGVAGLYTAWQVLKTKPELNVVVIERLNRTGGRLDTDLIRLGDATIRDEEGGMRFTEAMLELYRLIYDLELSEGIVPFPLTDENNRYYVRGQSFSVADANNDPTIWSQLYNLGSHEQRKSPGAILAEVFDRLLTANGRDPSAINTTPEFWQEFRLDYEWNGVKLNEWQTWGLLRNMGYTDQCVTMLSHTLGFMGPFLSLASAGEAFQILEDFPAKAEFHTFKDGFSTVPNALADRVEALGGKIFLACNLVKVDGQDGAFELTVTEATKPETASGPIPDPKAERKRINAPRVVLGVASKALRTLYSNSPPLHEQGNPTQLWSNLTSIQDMRLMKINLYYDEIWWPKSATSADGLMYGHSFSDTALGSVYPFYALENPEDSPAALTIYCDFTNTDFWQGLQNVGPLFDSPEQQEHAKPPQVLFAASQAVVAEVTSQFEALFDTRDVPQPMLTSYRNWDGEDAFGYAYHQWGIGALDRDVITQMIEPVPGIFTCNESYSDMQGWVNGTLRSADLMLEQLLKKA